MVKNLSDREKESIRLEIQRQILMNIAVRPVVEEDSSTRRDSGSFEIPMKPFFAAFPFPSVYQRIHYTHSSGNLLLRKSFRFRFFLGINRFAPRCNYYI